MRGAAGPPGTRRPRRALPPRFLALAKALPQAFLPGGVNQQLMAAHLNRHDTAAGHAWSCSPASLHPLQWGKTQLPSLCPPALGSAQAPTAGAGAHAHRTTQAGRGPWGPSGPTPPCKQGHQQQGRGSSATTMGPLAFEA